MLADGDIAVDVVEADDFLRVTVVFLDLGNSTLSVTVPRARYASTLRALVSTSYISDEVIIALVRCHLRPPRV